MTDTPPNSPQATSARTLAALRRLEWRVRHAVENVLSGEYRSTFRGRGMEFDQVVRYEFGDDVRDIDWNVTARLGEPYRKKFVEERESTVFILLEDSPSLQFGSGEVTKREALLELAGLVMLLGAINRDRVGFVLARPDGYEFRPAVRGRGKILHQAATLMNFPAPELAAEGSARAAIPWKLLSHAAPRHSILLWLGDFSPAVQPEGWSVMQRRYQTLGLCVDDPWERDFPDAEADALFDPVFGRLVSLTGTHAERQAHAEWKASREAAFHTLFPNSLSRCVIGTHEDRLEGLVGFFHRRMASARHA